MSKVKQVYFYCYGCLSYNKHNRDNPDFEMKQTKYESLTMAIEHIKDTGHNMHPAFEEYHEDE